MGNRGFWQELKRRHVYRVAAAYAIVGWLLIQVATQVFPIFHLPDWIDQAVVLLILTGFPIALVLAWAFDATPQGIVRTDAMSDVADAGAMTSTRSRRAGIAVGLIGILIALICGGAYLHFERGTRMVSRHAVGNSIANAPGAQSESTQHTSAAPQTAVANAPAIAIPPIPAKSIAVLPFENLSEDKSNQYFADGMQDLILTKLADVSDLKVISRTSTMTYASHPGDLKAIARQLGVANILEGSVQKAGKQVLINVQLINANTDSHIWAQSYQRTLDNIFGVEGEVTAKVVYALKATLTATEAQAIVAIPTRSQPAYEAYLKGLYHQKEFERTFDNLELNHSIELLRQAVKLDPDFADAYAQLASVDGMGGVNPDEEAKVTRRALALDPNNALAHQQLALVLRTSDPKNALLEAQRAVHLQPNSAVMQTGLGVTLGVLGRFDDAIVALKRAVALDPRVDLQRQILAEVLIRVRRYAQARDALLTAMAIDPGNLVAATQLADVYRLGWGDLDAARNVLNKVTAPVASSDLLWRHWYWQFLLERNYAKALAILDEAPAEMRSFDAERRAQIYQTEGDSARAKDAFTQARSKLEPLVKAKPDDVYLHVRLALILAGLGEREQALDEARRAVALKPLAQYPVDGPSFLEALAEVQARTGDTAAAIEQLRSLLQMPAGKDVSVPMLKLDPAWDPIRKDPRFQALLKEFASAKPAPATDGTGP